MVDIAIAGGGPAGAWTAWRLACAGARCLVFDASHPREKPCGGGVTGRALALVRAAIEGRALERVSVRAARFQAEPGEDEVRVPLDRQALAIFSRADFDRGLLDAAVEKGATLVRERVTDLAWSPDGVTIRTARGVHRAAFLVGADGANSLVRRRVARPLTRAQISIGAGFFAHGVVSDEMVIRWVADPPGYIWSFPRRDHLAVGICAQADTALSVERLKARARAWIERSGIAPGARLEPYAWPIPSLPAGDFARDRICGDRWALTGDAAGLVDPITREGIFFALQSAGLAADALLAGEGGRGYATRVAESIHPELRRAAALKAGFFSRRVTSLLMHALRESEPIRQVMADLVAGRQPYRGLRRRLLGTREWGLALNWLGRQVTPRW